MRSEAEIRREIESRLRRRGLLLVNGAAWSVVVFILSQIFPSRSLGTTLTSLLVLWMVGWTMVLGLHFLRTIYVEMREWLVSRAIARERSAYDLRDSAYAKPKRREEARLSDDGEFVDEPLIDLPDNETMVNAKAKHGR